MGSQAERIHGKAVAGGPSEVADCGVGWAKLQLADPATDRTTNSYCAGK